MSAPPPICVSRYRVENPNLAGWVEDSAGVSIVLAVAPAGYGKSTILHAMRERMREAGLRIGWLALGPQDNDVARFCARLLDAMSVNVEGPAPATLLDSSAASAQLAQRLLECLAHPPQPMAIFIDDFDHIAAPPLLQLVQRALETMAPGVRLFIATRSQPALKLVRWKAQGRLLQIGLHELAFDLEQADEFLNRRHRLGLSAQLVERLVRAAEGWPTGLQLAALALESAVDRQAFVERFCAADADIADYLLQEVFLALPQPLREFLLDTSILERLAPALCGAVAGIDDSAAMLRELERRNLFVQRDAIVSEQYRCHQLFRDFLRQQLREEGPDRLPLLYRRASDWHRSQGDVDTAIEHALSGGHTEMACELLMPRVWPALLAGQLSTVARWVLALPAPKRPPALQIVLGWSLVLQHRYPEADALLRELREQPAMRDEPDLRVLRPMTLALIDRIEECEQALSSVPASAYDASTSGCTLRNVRAYVHLAAQRWSEALADAQAARAGFEALGSRYGIAFSVGIEAQTRLAIGDSDGALALLELAHEDLVRHSGASSVCSAHAGVYLAELRYERGDFDQALALLQPNAEVVRATGAVDTIIISHRLLSRLHCRRGDYPAAVQAIQAAAELGQRLGLSRICTAMRLEAQYQAQHQFDRGRLDHLPASPPEDPIWARFADRLAPGSDVEQPLVVRLRTLVRSGAAGQALREIDAELGRARQRGRERLALQLGLLRAQAQARLEDGPGAAATLADVLHTHVRHCGSAVLQDEGPAMLALCVALLASGRLAEGAPVQRLLRVTCDEGAGQRVVPLAAPAAPAAPMRSRAVNMPVPLEALSERELEVLRCLVQGLPNKRIAAQLFISEPTVKFHLRNINAKLGARNRTHAVFIARQSGLVV